MAEFWKSTPKYWCKHCGIFVRDTKLERTNHESTAKHQNSIKRSLRELHRGHEREEREKDRAKREIERLSGVVSGKPHASSSAQARRLGGASGAPPANAQSLSQAERQRQLEQLAGLGVSIPTELRGDMAMAGEWSVTSTRTIKDQNADGDNEESGPLEARATGVRKRERDQTEEEKEEQNAVKDLFKRPRRWGRDTRSVPTENDDELDELLSGPLVRKEKVKDETKKEEETDDQDAAKLVKLERAEGQDAIKPEPQAPAEEGTPPIKQDPDDVGSEAIVPQVLAPDEAAKLAPGPGASTPAEAADPPAVVFKKRKPKNVRQK